MVLAVPTPRTWSVNDIATGAELNGIRDAINFLANPPLFQGYQAVATSIPNSAWSGVGIDTNVVDTYNGHSVSVNTANYTASVAGWYRVTARVAFAANATGIRGVAIGAGTTTPIAYTEQLTPAATTWIQTDSMIQLTAGSAVVILGFQSSGGALNTVATSSEFTCQWIHA